MKTHVAEIARDLTPFQLSVWERRSGKGAEYEEKLIAKWKGEKKPKKEAKAATPQPPLGTPEDYPCSHRLEPTGKTVGCGTCGKVTLEVYGCDLNEGGCVLDRGPKEKKIKCCKVCSDRPLEHKGGLSINQLKERAVASDGVAHRLAPFAQAKSSKEVNLKYQKEAAAFIASLMPYPADKYSGRGITIATGGKYWASAYVTVRMIRHVGCTLPVQCWYLGAAGERDERYEQLLAPFDVEFIDIDKHPARANRSGVAGFQTKLFAAINSPFEEVLSLDPDNYPCADPTVLFDDPRYKTLGAIYWPDGPQTDGWTNFAMAGASKRGPCGLETGQYVLHKRIAWEPMLLAEWYDDRPEWTYGKIANGGAGPEDCLTGMDYGDKGPPRVAFAKLERDYVVFNPMVHWYQFAFIQAGPDGWTPMFIHRSRSKFMADGPLKFTTTAQNGVNLKAGLPGEEAAFKFLEELKAGLE